MLCTTFHNFPSMLGSRIAFFCREHEVSFGQNFCVEIRKQAVWKGRWSEGGFLLALGMSHRPWGAYRANVRLHRPSRARPAAPGRAAEPLTAGFGSRGGHSGRSDMGAAAPVSRGSSASSFRGMDSGLLTCVARTFQPPGEAWLLSGFQNRQS